MPFWLRLLWLAASLRNPDAAGERTDRLAPADFHGNFYGPVASAAREAGTLPPLPVPAETARWDSWGRKNLRDGDIVFRLGDSRILFGKFPFSQFLANASNSPFSHTGVVAVEGGEPVVYDTTKDGPRRMPLAIWMLDTKGRFGVKRLKPELQDRVPKVLAFVRDAHARQTPFDFQLHLGDESLYCVEMTEKAFRAAGVPLSEPVKLGNMERAAEFPACMFGLQYVSSFALKNPLTFEQGVFFPGNESHGIWSSRDLVEVLPPTPAAVDGRPIRNDWRAAAPAAGAPVVDRH
jgi:hypothetical protein